jgi:hypothetical protein
MGERERDRENTEGGWRIRWRGLIFLTRDSHGRGPSPVWDRDGEKYTQREDTMGV